MKKYQISILFSEKSRFYEMSSFDEKQATTLLKERPIEFVNYNKHQLSRVYPAGTRFDSSNFMPQVNITYCLVLSSKVTPTREYSRYFQVGVRWVKFVNRAPKIRVNTTLTST